ncbi:MAG: bifunctional folylpolyglutamate synthase/dihydrofolate synthase [Gemmatimonadaceae bacterium]
MAVAEPGAYSRALERLFERTGGRIEPGLERTKALLAALGNPETKVKCFHVAGTNGKGSTCATIDALLRPGGRKIGRYSSPHLVDFRERVVVNGAAIPEGRVLALLDRIEPAAQANAATFFEITTALAFAYFAEVGVDAAVIETGLGGLLDSTNVVDPLVATVTNVSLDHTEYLGSTLLEIAYEKGGVFKFGRPAIIGEPRADLARLLIDRAAARGATPIEVVGSEWRSWSVSFAGGRTSFTAQTPYGELRLSTPLVGEHQVRNTLTALASVHAAGPDFALTPEEIKRALATVRLPGRFQRSGDWIFDVAHNGAGARALADTLAAVHPPRPLTVVLGVLKDKDWHGIITALAEVADLFIITQPPSAPPERAWSPLAAASYANACKIPVALDPDFGVALMRAEARPGTKVVAGSFHTVGDAMRRLGIDPLGIDPPLAAGAS